MLDLRRRDRQALDTVTTGAPHVIEAIAELGRQQPSHEITRLVLPTLDAPPDWLRAFDKLTSRESASGASVHGVGRVNQKRAAPASAPNDGR
jgi:hypothetical protein